MRAIIFRSITIIVTDQKNRQQPEHLQTYLIIVGIYLLLLFRLLFIATRFSTFQCLGTAFTTLVKVLTWRHTGTPKSRALARKTDICLLVILKQGILFERCCSSQYHHEEKRTQHRHLDQRNLVTLSLRFELSFPSASGKDWLAEFTTGELNLKDPVLH